MDLIKSYVIQSLSTASANLRLNSENIEVITLLKEYLEKADNLEEEIVRMKKRTELSKFAIKLDQIYSYISSGKPDFLTLSNKFKEQSAALLTDLSYILDISTPQSFNNLLSELSTESKLKSEVQKEDEKFLEESFLSNGTVSDQQEKIKERIIFSGLEDEKNFKFEDYEEIILKTVKEIEPLLRRLNTNEYTEEELQDIENRLLKNEELSLKAGFSLIADMHKITSKAMKLLREKKLLAVSPVVEGIRACLIVIVAVIRGKDVDITNYLNRAETFGEKISSAKEGII
jgi:hypothetical protein